MSEPRRYVPPDSEPPAPDPPVQNRKPWMSRRKGETAKQHADRVAHSCYRCGTYIVDLAALALHEGGCSEGDQ